MVKHALIVRPAFMLLFAVTSFLRPALLHAEASAPLNNPPLLQSRDGVLVDGHGQRIQLRGENIGNWLAWEQWIQRFGPNRFTNQLGRIVGEGNKGNRVNLRAAEAIEWVGAEPRAVREQSGMGNFNAGGFIRFKKTALTPSIGGFLLRYVQYSQAAGRFELRLDAPDGPLLAAVDTICSSKDTDAHAAEARGFFTPVTGGRDVFIVAQHTNTACDAVLLELSLLDVENKASAEELYDLMVDQTDASLTLYAAQADQQSGTSFAYDCEPDAIGGFGTGDFILFEQVSFPDGLTNLSILAATGNDHPQYDGRFRIELVDSNQVSRLFGDVALFHSGGWGNYDEYVIYTGQWMAAGTYSVKVSGLSGKDVGDVGNLHSLRFFKADQTDALIDQYRDTYFSTNDLDSLHELGINTLRVPFNYDLIMNDAGELLPEERWTNRLDWVVNECAKRGMYCILDLHGAPGGQNDYEQCMRKEGMRNRLWYVTEHQSRLLKIWTVLARHFRDHSAVAGYDLLNEPAPWWHSGDMNKELPERYNQRILPLHRQLYDTIRAEDPHHLIFMEDNAHMTWNSRFLNMLPDPQKEGWNQVVYEIHSYEHSLNSLFNDWRDSDMLTQKDVADENIRHILRFQTERNTPVFIGEFQPVSDDNYDYVLRRYNRRGIDWCHWNFKVAGWNDTRHPDRGWDYWGLQYQTDFHAGQPVDFKVDDPESLSRKFEAFAFRFFSPHQHLTRKFREHNHPETTPPPFAQSLRIGFAAPDCPKVEQTWCADHLTVLSDPASCFITNRNARLTTRHGPSILRLKSRRETEANLNLCGSGAVLSANITSFGGSLNGDGTELRLSLTRDLVTQSATNDSAPSVTASLRCDGSNQVKAVLSSKTTSGATPSAILLESDWMPFAAGETLSLSVHSNQASMAYGGWTSAPAAHGHTLANWPEGGLAVVEVHGSAGNDQHADLTALTAQSMDTPRSSWYRNDFANIPNFTMARALTDHINIQRTWSSAQGISSYVQDGKLVLLPNDENYQSVWMNLCANYQNPLQLSWSGGDSAGVAFTLSSFGRGRLKTCFMPEVFFGDIWGAYRGEALYIEAARENTNICFTAYRHLDAGGRREAIGTPIRVTYVDGAPFAMQMDEQTVQAFYNHVPVIDTEHGIRSAASLYRHGVSPHLEFQNFECTNAFVVLDDLVAVSRTR